MFPGRAERSAALTGCDGSRLPEDCTSCLMTAGPRCEVPK